MCPDIRSAQRSDVHSSLRNSNNALVKFCDFKAAEKSDGRVCEAFYVGKTKRRLEQRIQEHSQQGYSSLYKHSSDLCHQIDYSNPAVISVDNNDYRLQIKEALKIKDLKAYNSLNANIRSCELKLW